LSKRKAILDVAEEEARQDLTSEEDAEFRKFTADIKLKDAELKSLDERITELSEEIERDGQITAGAAAVRRAQARVSSVNESSTYVKGNGRSYLQDLIRHSLNMDSDGEALERLRRHSQDVATKDEYRDL